MHPSVPYAIAVAKRRERCMQHIALKIYRHYWRFGESRHDGPNQNTATSSALSSSNRIELASLLFPQLRLSQHACALRNASM
jgi:hypothetical protein